MNRKGFTVVEIIIVMAIAGVLLSMATFQFREYLQKGQIERQTKELYADLLAARSAAVTQQAVKTVTITPTTFTVSGSSPKVLSKAVTWSGKSSGDTQVQIIFDQRGTFNIDVGSGNTTICVDQSMESAQYDGIIVYSTRIHMGKLTIGEVCNSGNVAVK